MPPDGRPLLVFRREIVHPCAYVHDDLAVGLLFRPLQTGAALAGESHRLSGGGSYPLLDTGFDQNAYDDRRSDSACGARPIGADPGHRI